MVTHQKQYDKYQILRHGLALSVNEIKYMGMIS
jgi:hypothetical protein